MHGDAQTHDDDLANYIEFLHDFHIFYLSYEKENFRKITVFKSK